MSLPTPDSFCLITSYNYSITDRSVDATAISTTRKKRGATKGNMVVTPVITN